MEQTLFALPILPGQTEAARAFLRELGGPRRQEYVAGNRALGITQETWTVQVGPQGDLVIAYVAGEDLTRMFEQFAASQDGFDVWFKQRLQEVTGADLNTPPSGPPNGVLADARA